MPLGRRKNHYQQLTEFERGRVQWSREDTASRRPGSGRPRGTTEREDLRVRRMYCGATHCVCGRNSSYSWQHSDTTNCYKSVASRTAPSQTPCIAHSTDTKLLRLRWYQVEVHWRTEWRSVVFSNESRFCLGASNGRVLARRRPGERLQPTCLRPRHTGPTPGVMVWGAISYNSRSTLVVILRALTASLYVSLVIQPVVMPFMNSIQGGVFKHVNAHPHTAVVTQHALQSVDMLPWPARSPALSPIEHVWDIIGRQLQRHPQPALTVPVLTVQVGNRHGTPSHKLTHPAPARHNACTFSCLHSKFWRLHRLLMYQYFTFEIALLALTLT
ncbi:hypothetical protein AVEN_260805-1 [Araneus ventricosus]|uniref:Transposable element Tc1 transposase n=1 Tax=Araneus ventricosus TaxID=182803 RepID=A0A4Y2FA64_ARAVE|nr:hypothetical protein AVEN_260805-1 [Araneus ventricosus]